DLVLLGELVGAIAVRALQVARGGRPQREDVRVGEGQLHPRTLRRADPLHIDVIGGARERAGLRLFGASAGGELGGRNSKARFAEPTMTSRRARLTHGGKIKAAVWLAFPSARRPARLRAFQSETNSGRQRHYPWSASFLTVR